jgi:hypothetical protein
MRPAERYRLYALHCAQKARWKLELQTMVRCFWRWRQNGND